MTPSNHKKYYTSFLKGHEGQLHFAAHSHHFWPDISRKAHLDYWDDCALLSDQKWEKIFGNVIPKAQKHIAHLLGLKDSNQIVFAPNTHELLSRILSLFIGRSELKILTTSSEFHSWRRQIQRLQELPGVQVESHSTNDFLKNRRNLIEKLKISLNKKPDLFFISQVFFDSGVALTDAELLELQGATDKTTIMIVDGYHGFGAIPTDLSNLEGKIFYLGGGYKYAQAGEGAGFMVVPKGDWRPVYTGWFAEYGKLSHPSGKEVGYSQDGMAFFGATQDPSGLYRFNAIWDLFIEEQLTPNKIHEYVISLQKYFIENLPKTFLERFSLTPLYAPELSWHGHFLTFEAESLTAAKEAYEWLKSLKIITDLRGTRLRFGFGLYQSHGDIQEMFDRMKAF